MSVNGHPDTGTTRVGMPIVDLTTGLATTITVLLALAECARSGRGQLVETSLFDNALSLLHPHAANWFASGRTPVLTGSAHPNIATYDKFAADGGEMFLGIVNDGQFAKFCRLVGREDLLSDPRFATNATRLEHRALVRQEIERSIAGRDRAKFCTELMAAGVPAGPVNSVPEALSQPHVAARAMTVPVEDFRVLGMPMKLQRTPGSVKSKPPRFAQHTHEVLRGVGYRDEDIARLIESGAVLTQPVTKKA
jgi:crotonobetainyl-CoA:carnitine CoA-transferase CaiB-like acyl-CoA transferase